MKSAAELNIQENGGDIAEPHAIRRDYVIYLVIAIGASACAVGALIGAEMTSPGAQAFLLAVAIVATTVAAIILTEMRTVRRLDRIVEILASARQSEEYAQGYIDGVQRHTPTAVNRPPLRPVG